MNEIELIVQVLKQTFKGVAWHGPSFMYVLKGVDKVQASERPIDSRHTIWEIVNHCSYWMEAVTKAFHGEKMPDIESTEDWSKMGKTEKDWIKSQDRLRKAYEELVESIKDLNETQLTQKVHGTFKGKAYTTPYRKMLHGISDHNTYHAGQIAILKKRIV